MAQRAAVAVVVTARAAKAVAAQAVAAEAEHWEVRAARKVRVGLVATAT